MKVLIIGGTGHIGENLTRLLVDGGDNVVTMSRGKTWGGVPRTGRAILEYRQSLADGSFLALLEDEKPDVVVDILAGDITSVFVACENAGVSHLVACGSLWMLGPPAIVPTPETWQRLCPFDDYRRRWHDLMLIPDYRVAFTAILPPNICGPGKIPLDGHGGRSLEVHQAHQRGEEVVLPELGTNLIGPCDAEDVARGFFCAIKNREAAAGQIFNVGSAYALTAEKFIDTYAAIYGARIPIRFVPLETYIAEVSPEIGAHYHFVEHMCPDISKIIRELDYWPLYTPEETMGRAVKWMFDEKLLQ